MDRSSRSAACTAASRAILYWVTNPLWVGGSLAFIATDAWRANVFGIGTARVGDYVFKLVFIWISIGVAIVSLRYGKWIPNFGAFLRFVVLGFFSITVIIYGDQARVARLRRRTICRRRARSSSGSCRCCSSTTSASSCRTARPRRWRTRSATCRSRCSAAASLGVAHVRRSRSSASCSCCRAKQVTGIGGFIDAVTTVFHGVYGGAAHALLVVMTLCFVGALVTSGAVWMIGSDRIQAVAAYDGAFSRSSASSTGRLGTPVRVNVLSGVVVDVFMVVAVAASTAATNATFQVVLDIAISTTLLSYIWIFPAVLKLRYTHPDIPRPYILPCGKAAALGRDRAHDRLDRCSARGWRSSPGCSRTVRRGLRLPGHLGCLARKFEAYTLGTLAVIVLIGVVGYLLGGPVRRNEARVPGLGQELPPSPLAAD